MTGGLVGVMQDDFRLIKMEYTFWVDGATFVVADGPLSLWIANGELNLGEIEESIEVQGPVDRNDRLNMERAERYVTQLGVLPFVEASSGVRPLFPMDGSVAEKTIRWTFSNPEGWVFCVYNEGTGLTTGGVVHMRAKHYGVWLQ